MRNRIAKFFIFVLILLSAQESFAVKISITSVSGLDFGTCVQGDSPRTILPGSSENLQNASFRVGGDPNVAYTISLPTSVTITAGGGATKRMTVSSFTSNPSGTGSLNASGTAILYVGATLGAVLTNQFAGAYTGNFTVTVVY